jgi:hypothetical protein
MTRESRSCHKPDERPCGVDSVASHLTRQDAFETKTGKNRAYNEDVTTMLFRKGRIVKTDDVRKTLSPHNKVRRDTTPQTIEKSASNRLSLARIA